MSEAVSPEARSGLIDPAEMTMSQPMKRPSLKPMPDLGGMLQSPPEASAQADDTLAASPTIAPLPAIAQAKEVSRTVLPVPSMDMGVGDVSALDLGSDPAAVMTGVETDSRASHLFFGDRWHTLSHTHFSLLSSFVSLFLPFAPFLSLHLAPSPPPPSSLLLPHGLHSQHMSSFSFKHASS